VKYTIDKVAQMFVVTQARRSCQAHFRHRFNILHLPDGLKRTYIFLDHHLADFLDLSYTSCRRKRKRCHTRGISLSRLIIEARLKTWISRCSLPSRNQRKHITYVSPLLAQTRVWNKADRLGYLLDQGHIDINKIGAASVSSTNGSSPKELAAVLVSRGWDNNQR
jgi:hypothetical protein